MMNEQQPWNDVPIKSETRRRTVTVKQIMDAALLTFAENGVSGVTMRAIAKRAGIGAPSIYRFFTSKEALLFAITVAKMGEMTRGLEEHLQGVTGAGNKLRKCTWFILHFFESCPEFAAILFVSNPLGIWGRPHSDSAVGHQARILAGIVEQGQQTGEVDPDIDVKVLRDLYFGGLQRLTFLWVARGMTYRLSDAADQFTELLFEGIRKRPADQPRCPFLEWVQGGKEVQH